MKRKLEVLLLEDNVPTGVFMSEYLNRLDCLVNWFTHGKKVIDQIGEDNFYYDVAIIDLGLPDVDGESVIKELFWSFPRRGIVVCSGSVDYKRGNVNGVGFYISKKSFRDEIKDILDLYRR